MKLSNMSYKLAQINLTPSKHSPTTSELYIAQPDTIKETLAGKIFVLVEIDNNLQASLKIINFLIDRLVQNYYQNDKIILRERITTVTPEHIFEMALAKTNTNFREFLEAEKLSINLDAINIIAGVIHNQTLYFTNTGKNKVLLIYKAKEAGSRKPSGDGDSGKSQYRITDLAAEQPGNEEGVNTPKKLFANVVSGQIPSKGYVLVANEALPEYLSNQQLIDIVTTLPPQGAVEQIKTVLEKINSYVPFLGILIKRTSLERAAEPKLAAPINTQDSITELNATEDNTETLLSPSGLINLKKWFSFASFSGSKDKKTGRENKSIILKEKMYGKRKSLIPIKGLLSGAKSIFLWLINIAYIIIKTAANWRQAGESFGKLPTIFYLKLRRVFRFLTGMSNFRRILLLTSLVLLAVLFANIAINRQRQNNQAIEDQYRELADEIQRKQNQAEASLLYSNEAGAQKLFEEITALMEQLPQATDEQKEQYNTFKKKLEEQLEITRRVVRIDDAVELADLANLNGNAQPDNIILSPQGGKLYAADSRDKSIYVLDTDNNAVTTVTDVSLDIQTLWYPTFADEENIYYFNQQSIISLSTKDETMTGLSINLLGKSEQISGAATYSGRLYLLDREDDQIYRFNRSGNAFSSPYAWVQGDADFNNAQGLAIDGYVYVLLADGQILKYLRGEPQDFRLEAAVQPPLSATTKIQVSQDQKYIYILEPSEKRLILFDKTGQYIEQYKADKFDNLKDFYVDEPGKTMYFLNGTKIYSAPATFLEETTAEAGQ